MLRHVILNRNELGEARLEEKYRDDMYEAILAVFIL